jgi:hypothetical protein
LSFGPPLPPKTPRRLFRAFSLPAVAAVLGGLIVAGLAQAESEEPLPHVTTTAIQCKSPITVEQASDCTVTVRDPSPSATAVTPEGEVALTTSRSGSFSKPCTLLPVSRGVARCSVTYTPRLTLEELGFHSITAAYPGQPGDGTTPALRPSQASVLIRVVDANPTATTLECDPGTLLLGRASTCRATVTDITTTPLPSEAPRAVRFSSDHAGSFSSPACQVSFTGEQAEESVSCQVTYTPTRIGSIPHRITAFYVGDPTHEASQESFSIALPATATTLTCSPKSVTVGHEASCTATVEDTRPAPSTPTGKVDLTSNAQGNFSDGPSCDLSASTPRRAFCQFAYTPTDVGPGAHLLTATYKGDGAHEQAPDTERIGVLSGTIRYAAPDGTGFDPCDDPERPCSLFRAADQRSEDTTIEKGDEVILAPGTYSSPRDLGEDSLLLPNGITMHGAAGRPRPVISIDNQTSPAAVVIGGNSEVSHLEVIDSGRRAILAGGINGLKDGAVIDDLIARSSGSGAIACDLGAAELTIRDTACLSSGPGSTALGNAISVAGVAITARLRNVTAISTGAESFGLKFAVDGIGESSPVYVADGMAVLARGTAKDVVAEAGRVASQPAATVEVELRNSDYRNTDVLTEEGATARVTQAGSGANILGLPLLAADGVHQLPASPTVDAGATDKLSGATDIDGSSRTLGLASDIGADEFAPKSATRIVCTPASIAAREETTCTATAEDADPSPTTPHGTVEFASDGAGSFSGNGICELPSGAGGNTASCQVTYTPDQVGTGHHRITAVYHATDHDPSQATTEVTVSPRRTTAALECEPSPAFLGDTALCTVTVEDPGPNPSAPTGTVEFTHTNLGDFVVPRCDLNPEGEAKASCSVSYDPAASGLHAITADYPGDDNHTSNTASFQLTVQGERNRTETAVSCEPTSLTEGEATTCTATVTDISPSPSPPTETVNFTHENQGEFTPDASCQLGPGREGKTATCAVTYIPTAPGPHKIRAIYTGDETHGTSNESTTIDVDAAQGSATKTAVNCEPGEPTEGETVSCTAEVLNDGENSNPITGIISFSHSNQGSFSEETCELSGDDQRATCAVDYTPTSPGPHTITAIYSGDATHATSHESTTIEAKVGEGAATETIVDCEPGELDEGGEVSCTATITSEDGNAGAITGTISFAHSNRGSFTPEARCTPIGDELSATCAVTYIPTAPGPHTITAIYSGDTTHATSHESTTIEVNVAPGSATETAVDCEPGEPGEGATTHCTAEVLNDGENSNSITGIVSFSHSSKGSFSPEAQCELSGDAQRATCAVDYTPTAPGPHTITAIYSGDPTHATSHESTTIEVSVAPGTATETVVDCKPGELSEGSTTHCTAEVLNDGENSNSITGIVSFSHSNRGSFSEETCELSGDSQSATCAVDYTPTAPGPHGITAIYSGDATHATSNRSTTVEVTVAQGNATETAVSCQPQSVILGGSAACTVTVEDPGADATPPAGRVSFETDGQGRFADPGSCNLFPSGETKSTCQIVYTPAPPAPATDRITANYEGDADHARSSRSTQLSVVAQNGGQTTETTLQCEPSDVILGGVSICTVKVKDLAADPSTPGGGVVFASNDAGTFASGGCSLFEVTRGEARCQVVYKPSEVGSGGHEITAIYPGDPGHEPSDATDLVNVSPPNGGHATTTAVECHPAALAVGKATTCTATVIDTNPSAPTEAVFFGSDSPGAFDFGSCDLDSQGQEPGKAACSVTYTPNAVGSGSHTITAAYAGDAGHEPSQATTALRVIDPAHGNATNITCDPSTLTEGGTTQCTVTVEDTDPDPIIPTETVNITHTNQGDLSADSCELTGSGDGKTASCTVDYTPTAAGEHELTATYPGDGTHSGGEETTILTVSAVHDTTASLDCKPETVILGGAAACTVTVEDSSDTDLSSPSGDVSFETNAQGSFSSDTCALFSTGEAEARCQVLYTPGQAGAAPHGITATYEGDVNHNGNQASAQLTIAPPNGGHATTTVLDCQPGNVILGGIAVCTVTVTDTAANPTAPVGGVIFASDSSGTFAPGGCALFAVAKDKARCQVVYTPTPAGPSPHEVTAIFPGDANHEPSLGADPVDVSPANGGHATATILDCGGEATVGKATTCSATVTDTDPNPSPLTRAVVFASDSPGTFSVGGCQLRQDAGNDASCEFTYTPSARGTGTHTITAAYEGDPGHEPSPPVTAQVTVEAPIEEPLPPARPTTTSVSCTPVSAPVGGASTCTATVADSGANPGVPGGVVKFTTDGPGAFSSAGSCTLAAGQGKATCQVTYTPAQVGAGVHKLTAAYQGNPTHAQSQGSAQLQVTAPTIPPNTILRKKPRKKTALRMAKFKFVSDQPGSSFQCKLDRKPFKSCRSPFKAKVKPGRHTFKVRAVNAQGTADPTPAVFRWTVGKIGKRTG